MESQSSLWFISDNQKSYAQIACYISCGCMFILLISSRFHSCYNIIDSLTRIYFLFFLKLSYPANLLDFSKFFGSYQYSSLNNAISTYTTPSTALSTHPLFAASGFKSSFFSNASLSFTIIGAITVLYLSLKLLSILPLSFLRSFIRPRLARSWEYDAAINLLISFQTQLAIFAALYLGQYSLSTNTDKASLATFILTSLILLASPFLSTWVIYSRRFDFWLSQDLLDTPIQFHCLLRGLKINKEDMPQYKMDTRNVITSSMRAHLDLYKQSHDLQRSAKKLYTPEQLTTFTKYGKYLNPMQMCYRLVFALIIVIPSDILNLQLGILCALSIAFIVVYIYSKPYLWKFDNYRNILTELCFLAVQVLLAFIDARPANDAYTTTVLNIDASQIKYGWIIILLELTILAVSLIDVVYKTTRAILSLRSSEQTAVVQQPRPRPSQANAVRTGMKESDITPKIKVLAVSTAKAYTVEKKDPSKSFLLFAPQTSATAANNKDATTNSNIADNLTASSYSPTSHNNNNNNASMYSTPNNILSKSSFSRPPPPNRRNPSSTGTAYNNSQETFSQAAFSADKRQRGRQPPPPPPPKGNKRQHPHSMMNIRRPTQAQGKGQPPQSKTPQQIKRKFNKLSAYEEEEEEENIFQKYNRSNKQQYKQEQGGPKKYQNDFLDKLPPSRARSSFQSRFGAGFALRDGDEFDDDAMVEEGDQMPQRQLLDGRQNSPAGVPPLTDDFSLPTQTDQLIPSRSRTAYSSSQERQQLKAIVNPNARKSHMRFQMFKRNPFISENDQFLVDKERNNTTTTTITSMLNIDYSHDRGGAAEDKSTNDSHF